MATYTHTQTRLHLSLVLTRQAYRALGSCQSVANSITKVSQVSCMICIMPSCLLRAVERVQAGAGGRKRLRAHTPTRDFSLQLRRAWGSLGHEACANSRMDAWLVRWLVGWLDGWWMHGWLADWLAGWVGGYADGWMDGWMGGWMDWWVDGKLYDWNPPPLVTHSTGSIVSLCVF